MRRRRCRVEVGGAAHFADYAHRVLIQIIVDFFGSIALADCVAVTTFCSIFILRNGQKFFVVLGLRLFAPEIADRRYFVFADQRSVDAMQAGGAGGQVQHVAFAEQRFRAVGIENGARVDFAGHAEGNACREVSFDQAGDYVHRRTLGGQNQMDTDGPGHLRQASDGLFDVLVSTIIRSANSSMTMTR